jgi:exopolysaccharide biosynthesis polyprenyl glycosylphosphotransferase
LKQFDRGLRTAVLSLDVLISATAFVAVIALMVQDDSAALTRAGSVKLIVLGLVTSLVWPVTLQSTVAARATRQVRVSSLFALLFLAGSLSAVVVAATAFALRAPIPPMTLLACVLAQLASVSAFRISILGFLRLARRRGRNVRNLLIAGSGPRAREVHRTVERHPEWGYRVVGFVDEGDYPADPGIPAEAVHKFVDMPALIREQVIDEVIAACPRSVFGSLGSLVAICAQAGLPITLLTDIFGDYLPPPQVTRFDTMAALSFSPVHHSRSKLGVKRAIDAVGSGVLLLLAAPIIGAAAVAIKLTSPGPVFFRQNRCGLYGRRFEMLKLRTMVLDAEDRQTTLLDLNEMDGPVFKIKNDPRVTKVGAILRRFSIDELPQLWNVLRGDMSLVGPRPPIPLEVARYQTFERRRLSVRPGITCLWQVNGRNAIDFADWVKLDVEYIDTWSLKNDFKILLRTIPVVLNGSGE